MAKSKKKLFHCEKCGNACEIYKKGKKHRVLVCPQCGVLATNPLPLMAAAALPGLIQGASRIFGGDKEQQPAAVAQVRQVAPRDSNASLNRIKYALSGK